MTHTPHSDIVAAYLAALRAVADCRLPDADVMSQLGRLIDLSGDLQRLEGIDAAIAAGDRLLTREQTPVERALLHYFLGNAWATRWSLSRSGWERAAWEQPEIDRQIVHLRSALAVGDGGALPPERLTQVLTNLGNLMSHCGRLIEAVAYWDRALALTPSHGMARGNRGYGLEQLARQSYDTGHQGLLLHGAREEIRRALAGPLDPGARDAFRAALSRIEGAVPPGFFEQSFDYDWPTDMPDDERGYRSWALNERLFLNDLNALGPTPIAAADVLVLPTLVTPLDAGPAPFGFFNQLKQEYVSARYFLFEGLHATGPHFSDFDVTLLNTLDYPAYGLAVERTRVAFRMAYSLLDKVAFFLNDYLALGIPETHVSFKKIWFERKRPFGIRHEISRRRNMPLLGLFWLSKDLFENDPGFRDALEPDARELEVIRQHLEHKYLKVHDAEWDGVTEPRDALEAGQVDTLAHSLRRSDFIRRTLHMLRLARAALIYLAGAVYIEEAERAHDPSAPQIALPIQLDTVEDDWKY